MALVLLPPASQPCPHLPPALRTSATNLGGGRLLVTLWGDAVMSSRAVLSDMLSHVITQKIDDVIIDLNNVRVFDRSAGRVLAMGHWLLESQGRKLTFRSPSQEATPILQVFGLADLVEADAGLGR